jgi:hypothetical protein
LSELDPKEKSTTTFRTVIRLNELVKSFDLKKELEQGNPFVDNASDRGSVRLETDGSVVRS